MPTWQNDTRGPASNTRAIRHIFAGFTVSMLGRQLYGGKRLPFGLRHPNRAVAPGLHRTGAAPCGVGRPDQPVVGQTGAAARTVGSRRCASLLNLFCFFMHSTVPCEDVDALGAIA